MTSHLRQYLKSGTDGGSSTSLRRMRSTPRMAILLAESGFLAESETLITQLERRPSSDRLALRQLARGVLELRKGDAGTSIQFIENTLTEGSRPSSHYLSVITTPGRGMEPRERTAEGSTGTGRGLREKVSGIGSQFKLTHHVVKSSVSSGQALQRNGSRCGCSKDRG